MPINQVSLCQLFLPFCHSVLVVCQKPSIVLTSYLQNMSEVLYLIKVISQITERFFNAQNAGEYPLFLPSKGILELYGVGLLTFFSVL